MGGGERVRKKHLFLSEKYGQGKSSVQGDYGTSRQKYSKDSWRYGLAGQERRRGFELQICKMRGRS